MTTPISVRNKRMVKWFAKLSGEKKDFFVLASFGLIVFIFLIPLMFVGHGDWPLGWLWGTAIELVCYYSLMKFAISFTTEDPSNPKIMTYLFSGLRYFLYAVGLVLAAICTFKSEWFGGWTALNFYATALAYLPMPIVITITHLIRNKKLIKETEKAKETSPDNSEAKKK